MSDPNEDLLVELDVPGESRFEMRYNSAVLQDHTLDFAGVPKQQQLGQARRLLCGAAAYCLAGTVYAALRGRNADVRSLSARASAVAGRDAGGITRVQRLEISVEVELPDEDLDKLERVKSIMDSRGCLITRSIEAGIDVSHSITRVKSPRA